VAEQVLEQWPDVLPQFVKVMPRDYKRVLQEMRRQAEAEQTETAVSP
jgi:glutamate synthase domain-containing protein 3